MSKQQQIIKLIVGLLGLAALAFGLLGIGRMSGFWRWVHIASGTAMAWDAYPLLRQFFISLTRK